jgi:hypothetical protein
MTLRLAYNTTDSVVLCDGQGFVIGGRSWGAVDTTDSIYKREFAAGRLVECDEDAAAGSDNPDAKAAVDALRSRRDAVQAARKLSKDELIEALPDDVVEALPEGKDGKPSKDDLVDAAAASDEVEKSTTTKPRRGQK